MKKELIVSIIIFLCIVFSYAYFILDSAPTGVEPSPANSSINTTFFKTHPVEKNYPYTLRGNTGNIKIYLYGGTLGEIERNGMPVECWRYDYDKSPCNYQETTEYYKAFVNEELQQGTITDITNEIKNITLDKDDQVRIAVSLVQNIPYFNAGVAQYPYQTLYYHSGSCQDKSLLLASILSELGYGSEVFLFKAENHMAIGISSNSTSYSYNNTGYAFVETTVPSIITYSNGNYNGNVTLTSIPIEYVIFEGDSMNTLSEDYDDSQKYNLLQHMGFVLPEPLYDELTTINMKYGLIESGGSVMSINYGNNYL